MPRPRYPLFLASCFLAAASLPAAEAAALQAAAARIFVSPQGNDAAPGLSAEQPVRTLPRALEVARTLRARAEAASPAGAKPKRQPIEIVLRGGIYPIASEPIQIGLEDAWPLDIVAWPGERPILDGGARIENWSQQMVDGRAMWVADLPEVARGEWYFFQLFVGGRRAPRPRLPKEGFYTVKDPLLGEGKAYLDDAARDRFVFEPGHIKAWRNLNDVRVMVVHYWQEQFLPVASVDESQSLVTFSRKSFFPFLASHPAHGAGNAQYYVDNVREALSEPGQWYLDRAEGKLYYIPRPDEDPKTTEVWAPRATQILRVTGDPAAKAYVTGLRFRGLTFRHTEILPDAHFGTGNAPGNSGPGIVSLAGVEHSAIEDCLFEHIGEYGIELRPGCRHINVARNTFRDMACGATKNQGTADLTNPSTHNTHNTFTDNTIESGGRIFHGAPALLNWGSAQTVVAHNRIRDFYYNGIVLGSNRYEIRVAHDNLIERNHISDIGQGWLSDMGGIYVHGNQPGTIIRHNLIHDVNCHVYGSNAIYLDDDAAHMLVENNLCYRTNTQVLNLKGRRNTVRNNIFAFGRLAQIRRASAHKEDTDIATIYNNILLTDGAPVFRTQYGWPVLEPGWRSVANLVWDVSGQPLTCAQPQPRNAPPIVVSFEDWQKKGHQDCTSVIADPRFADAAGGDFTLPPDSPAFAMGFVAFDLSDVGPRGKATDEKAQTGPERPALNEVGHIE